MHSKTLTWWYRLGSKSTKVIITVIFCMCFCASFAVGTAKFKQKNNVPHLKRYIIEKYTKVPKKTAETIAVHADKLSKKHNVDFHLVVGIMETESSFNPSAKYKGNIGLMQVSYKSWKRPLGIKKATDLHNIEYNIDTGVKILKRCIVASKGDTRKALRMYNGNANKSFTKTVSKHIGSFENFRSKLQQG